MNEKLTSDALAKLAAVTPIQRPTSGPFARMGPSVYSDKGTFYRATTENGPTATAYRRPAADGKAPNLAVATPGRWTKSDISALADEIYGKNGLATNGKVVGVDRDQFMREVASHDYMDAEGGPHGPLGYVDPWAMAANVAGRLYKSEKDPAAIADMRGTSGWKSRLEDVGHRFMQLRANMPGWMKATSMLSAPGIAAQAIARMTRNLMNGQREKERQQAYLRQMKPMDYPGRDALRQAYASGPKAWISDPTADRRRTFLSGR